MMKILLEDHSTHSKTFLYFKDVLRRFSLSLQDSVRLRLEPEDAFQLFQDVKP